MNSSPLRLQCMSTIRKTKIHTTLAEHRHDYKILVPKKYSQLCVHTHVPFLYWKECKKCKLPMERTVSLLRWEGTFTGHFLSLHCNHENNLVKIKVNSKRSKNKDRRPRQQRNHTWKATLPGSYTGFSVPVRNLFKDICRAEQKI